MSALNKEQAAPRKLGLGMSTALVIGNMIGSGIFLLPTSLAPYGGLGFILLLLGIPVYVWLVKEQQDRKVHECT